MTCNKKNKKPNNINNSNSKFDLAKTVKNLKDLSYLVGMATTTYTFIANNPHIMSIIDYLRT